MARSGKQRNVEPKKTQNNIKLSKRDIGMKSTSNPLVTDTADNHKVAKPVDQIKSMQIPGCLTCRQRHLKCSRTQPACQQCIKSKYMCYWKKEGTKFSDYDIILTAVSEPQGCLLDPVRDSKKDSDKTKLSLNDKKIVNSINEISLMSNDPEVMMIQDAVSVFSERIKDIEPESNLIDIMSVSTANQISSINDDVVEHHKSPSEAGSNRTSIEDESINDTRKVYLSSQCLFEHSFSELEKKLNDELDDKRETEQRCKEDETGTQLTICRSETQDDSWSSIASQANCLNVPPIDLLLEFQNRVKELEASVQVLHPNAKPIGAHIDWYTNSVCSQSPGQGKEQMSTNIEKDLSTALAIANILETRLIDNEASKTEEAKQVCDSPLPNNETSNSIDNSKPLKVAKLKNPNRKSRKTEPRDMTTLTIPDIREMKERIERLSETLEKANTKINKDLKQDGRRYRYSHGLKAVDHAKLPPSITKFMRT